MTLWGLCPEGHQFLKEGGAPAGVVVSAGDGSGEHVDVGFGECFGDCVDVWMHCFFVFADSEANTHVV